MLTKGLVLAVFAACLAVSAPLNAQFSPPPPTVIPDTRVEDNEAAATAGPVRLSPPLAVVIRQKSGGLVRGRLTEVTGEAVVVNTERQQGITIKLSAIRNLRTAEGELQWQSDQDQPGALLAAARRLAGATAQVGAPAAAGEPPAGNERPRPQGTDLFEGRPVSSAPLPSSPSAPATTFAPPAEPPRDLFESQPVSSGVPAPAQVPAEAPAESSATPGASDAAAAPATASDEIRISASTLRTAVTVFVAVLAALVIAAAILWRMNAAPAESKPSRKRPRVKS